jgi:hypothetical protein
MCRGRSRSPFRPSTRVSTSSPPSCPARIQLQANSLAIIRTGAGHTPRIRQRTLGPEAPHALRPAGDTDRLCARRCLSYRRREPDGGADLPGHRRLAHARHRRRRGRRPVAADRPAFRGRQRSSRECRSSPLRRRRTSGFRTRTPGPSISKTATCSPEPFPRIRPMGGFLAGHLRARLVLRASEPGDQLNGRPELPAQSQARHLPARNRADRPLSDVVGRTRVRYGRFLDLSHRFRLDKDNLAVRRNEIDLTMGSELTYIQAGYLRLNRDIDPAVEDLRDREELRLQGGSSSRATGRCSVRRSSTLRARTKTLFRSPMAGSRFEIASESLMRTNAWSLGLRGGAISSGWGSSARARPLHSR